MNQFIRFGIVGAGGFIVDSAVLFIAHKLIGLDPYTARAISIFTAMNFTWFGNRVLTFRSHAAAAGRAMLNEWMRFIGSNALGALANYSVYAALVRFAPWPFCDLYVALVAGVATGLVFNFLMSKHFVFRHPPI